MQWFLGTPMLCDTSTECTVKLITSDGLYWSDRENYNFIKNVVIYVCGISLCRNPLMLWASGKHSYKVSD